jgi:uncharacterized protein YdiU (UPF0061 family)
MRAEPQAAAYRADPQILALADWLGDAVAPADFPMAELRFRNRRWDKTVGLADLADEDWVRHFARFESLPENIPQPLALRYHGHQFRVYNPDIGDGRGFTFAQLRDGGTACSTSAPKARGSPRTAARPMAGSRSRARCARFWRPRCSRRSGSTPRRRSR